MVRTSKGLAESVAIGETSVASYVYKLRTTVYIGIYTVRRTVQYTRVYLKTARQQVRPVESHLDVVDIDGLLEREREFAIVFAVSARPPRQRVVNLAVPGKLGSTPFGRALVESAVKADRVVAARRHRDCGEGPGLHIAVEARRPRVDAGVPVLTAAADRRHVGTSA